MPLVGQRLVETIVDPDDRRGRLLVLKNAGRKRLNAALPIWHRTHAEIDRLVRSNAEGLRAGLQALS
jgi:DNA-binding MarR family transcriptional regulator